MTITTHIQDIIDITNKAKHKDLVLRTTYNIPSQFEFSNPSDSNAAYLTESMKLNDALKDYLENLPATVLEYLISLMCIGRDRTQIANENDFQLYHQDLMVVGRFNNNREECIRYISEKSNNLDYYFSNTINTSNFASL